MQNTNKNIKATGIGRKHERNDLRIYIEDPNMLSFRSERKQSNDIIVSDVCPTTCAEENALVKIAGY